jgi:hypothetical protein
MTDDGGAGECFANECDDVAGRASRSAPDMAAMSAG